MRCTTRAQLKLEYDAGMTRNAAEAFAAREGNCLSLVIMTAAFAKEMDFTFVTRTCYVDETWSARRRLLPRRSATSICRSAGGGSTRPLRRRNEQRFDDDRLPAPGEIRGARTGRSTEPTIVAMYMNNRAVESLASGRARRRLLVGARGRPAGPALHRARTTRSASSIAARRSGGARARLRVRAGPRAGQHARAVEPGRRCCTTGPQPRKRERFARSSTKIEPNPPFGYFKRGIAAMQAATSRLARSCSPRRSTARPTTTSSISGWRLPTLGLGDT